jgi:putative membrane protein insertion efficiency factor
MSAPTPTRLEVAAPAGPVLGDRPSAPQGRPGPLSRALVSAIRTYQLARSGRPTGCRFTPTCSQYALEAVETRGAWRGGALALRRLVRCRPWGGFGFDPLPERRTP